MFVCPQGLANPIVRLVDNYHIFLRLVDHSCNDLRVFFIIGSWSDFNRKAPCATIRFLHFDYTLGAFRVVV